MNKMREVYLDEEGYREVLKNIDDIKRQISDINGSRKDAMVSVSDAYHSKTLSDIEEKKAMLMSQLQDCYDILNRAKFIEKQEIKDIIDINDTVVLNMKYIDENEEEEITVKLVGTDSNFDKDIIETSINSPLGNAIYQKHIGERTFYKVENDKIDIYIKEKVNNNNLVRSK